MVKYMKSLKLKQIIINNDLINVRIACHPRRLMTDLERLSKSSKPLITPASSIADNILNSMSSIEIFDYGLV